MPGLQEGRTLFEGQTLAMEGLSKERPHRRRMSDKVVNLPHFLLVERLPAFPCGGIGAEAMQERPDLRDREAHPLCM